MHQQIVEIDSVVLEQKFLINRIDFREHFVGAGLVLSLHHLGRHNAILKAANSFDDVADIQMCERDFGVYDCMLHGPF